MTEGNGEVRELPKGWKWTQLGNLGNIISGGTPSTKIDKYWSDEIPWISPADLSGYTSKFISKGRKSLSKIGLENSSAKLMPAGSILFSSRAPIGYVAISTNEICTNQGFKSLIPSEAIFNEYVYYYLKASKQLAEKYSSGTTFKELSGKSFSILPIPLPPNKEQKRIVEKIEELFSELDQGIESLKTAQKQLKVYRQAVLKWAFEGRLTEGWRKQHSSTLKTREALLAQIKAERENRYQQQLAEWEEKVRDWEAIGKVGKKPTKLSKLKNTSLLTETELSELPKLPHSWCWLRFGELVSSIRGGTTAVPIDTSTDYPILRSSSVRAGTIDYSDVRFLTSQQASNIKDFVEVDDLLFTRLNGTVDYVGNCSRVTEYHPNSLIYPDRLYCTKLLLVTMAKYVEKVFENPILRRIIEKKAKSTAGHKRISIPDVLDMPFPLPNSEEMDVILLDLETRLSIVEKFEATIIENLQKAEALRQSILKQAFEGKLVPQDPTDEPAEKLLERIQQEKQMAKAK